MAYTYVSKKQRNKGNATTHPPKKRRKCHYILNSIQIPSHQPFGGGMGLSMCSGIYTTVCAQPETISGRQKYIQCYKVLYTKDENW